MRKTNSEFKTAFLSEAGSQLENRDYFGYVELDDYACWVLADGIDECESKQSAELIVKDILESFTTNPGNSKKLLREYITEAHKLLRKESTRVRLKASVMVVVTDYVTIRYVMSGNVHLQLVSQNRISLESKDQSYYQQKVDDDTFPTDRSKGFRERNNLTNYLGTPAQFRPYISKKMKLKETDTMIFMTVGIWEHVNNSEVLDGVDQTSDPQAVIDNLEDVLLSKQYRLLKNYTVAAVFVNKLFLKEKKWWPVLKKVLMILIPILIIALVLGFFALRNRRQRLDMIERIGIHEQRGDQYIEDGNFRRALEQYTEAIDLLMDVRNYENEDLERKKRVNVFVVEGISSSDRDELDQARTNFIRARDYMITYDQELDLFDMGFVLNRIDYINTRIYISDLIVLGDIQVEANQHESAINTFLAARQAAVNINRQDMLQLIDVRLERARSLSEAADANEAAADATAAAAAAAADVADGLLDPETAAGRYDEIARKFEEAGMHDRAAEMRARAEQLRADAAATELARQEVVARGLEERGDEALLQGDYQLALTYYQAAESIYRSIGSVTGLTVITQKILAVNELIRVQQSQQP